MSQDRKTNEVPSNQTGNSMSAGPKSNPNVFFAIGAVLVLIAAIIGMLIITSNDVSTTPAPATLSAEAQEGKLLFVGAIANCNNCHPQEGRAGGVGPRLSTINDSDDAIRRYVRNGAGAMPANKTLTDDQIGKIITYLHALKPA